MARSRKARKVSRKISRKRRSTKRCPSGCVKKAPKRSVKRKMKNSRRRVSRKASRKRRSVKKKKSKAPRKVNRKLNHKFKMKSLAESTYSKAQKTKGYGVFINDPEVEVRKNIFDYLQSEKALQEKLKEIKLRLVTSSWSVIGWKKTNNEDGLVTIKLELPNFDFDLYYDIDPNLILRKNALNIGPDKKSILNKKEWKFLKSKKL